VSQYYAKVRDSRVIEIIVASPEFFQTFVDTTPGTWLETCAFTKRNQHTQGGTPLRGNFAAFGYVYDHDHDVFYAPQPYASWTLDSATWTWQPPIPRPEWDGHTLYDWSETDQAWLVSAELPRE
jgi:hypothetical protein